ncbi:protein of unknown function [Thermomonospora echinospora]|uniref:DUF3598 domain-containing protein n=1 Tax=Thermomonospora echinospora TaxID=1992 RepID=A0A1H5U2U9_9ACTN|nr:DUF3598 family protein [Thermomonospora echinospora]SEF68581.1 protein of unknown function [Thermomonospora echinospora]
MTIAEILQRTSGVWEGTYTVLDAEGELLERFASRQEGLMEGTDWTEKVVYLRDGSEPEVRYYRAVVDGDSVEFVDDEMWGTTLRAGGQAILFTFGWNARPQERIVEMSMADGDYRTRLWQHFENGALSRLTMVEERRLPGAEPERWYTPPAAGETASA